MDVWIGDAFAHPGWMLALAVNAALAFALAKPINAVFDRASGGQRTLDRYAAMFELAQNEAWASPMLARLRGCLREETGASRQVGRLARLVGFSELRSGGPMLHLPMQALSLWDLHLLFALERWRRRSGRRVRRWLEALGEIDALAVLSSGARRQS